jgi:hypothetical protein
VVHFSGHGAMVHRKFYLLPDEVDARDDAGIKASVLSAEDLRGELLELARYGRVLVLLDAAIPAPRRWTARRSPSMRTRWAPASPRRT